MAEKQSVNERIEEALLAVDIGNTTVSLGCVISENGEDTVLIKDRFPTAEGNNPAVIRRTLERLMAGAKERLTAEAQAAAFALQITGIVISSVVPSVTETVKREAETYFQAPIVEITSKSLTGLIFRSIDMSTLGHDRIVDAAWAAANVKLPAVTVDMGTATTVTVVDQKGRYIGGAILPGVGLSMNALTAGTSLLPKIEIVPPNKVIATNTVECMKAGIIFGAAGAIDGVLDRFTESLQATGDEEWSIVATGGLAGTICPCCRHQIVMDDNLLLKGLHIIWEKNRGSRKKTK